MKKRERPILNITDEYMAELGKEVDRMFEARFIERPSWDVSSATLEPLSNMLVLSREVVITADLPCSDMKSITVKASKRNIIEISAKTKRTISFDEFGITHRRGKFSSFFARISIPVPVNITKMKTLCRNGILEVRIPRKLGHSTKLE